MSIENVKAFYQRLISDETFCTKIQSINSKTECTQIVRDAGYYFTQEEYEKYTHQLLESDNTDSELQDLDEKELEAVMGGASSIIGNWKNMQQPYGVVETPFTL
ncbi:MAG: Nif11-like leader peptide family natural product precursor [Rhizonema sp. PD38]|nr:Nif11-like leader peptide family natural product precursor [Rhizonema sp. PD38]